jgi:hypothetical protein
MINENEKNKIKIKNKEERYFVSEALKQKLRKLYFKGDGSKLFQHFA